MQATVKKEKECVIVYKNYRGKGDDVSARTPGPDCKRPLKFYDKVSDDSHTIMFAKFWKHASYTVTYKMHIHLDV